MSIGPNAKTESRFSHIRLSASMLFAVAGMVAGISSQTALAQNAGDMNSASQSGTRGAQTGANAKKMMAKLGTPHKVEYTIEHPDRMESRAIRHISTVLPHLNTEKTAFSRFVVEARDEATFQAALKSALAVSGTARQGSHQYERFIGLDNTFVV